MTALSPAKIAAIQDLRNAGYTREEVASALDVSVGSVDKYSTAPAGSTTPVPAANLAAAVTVPSVEDDYDDITEDAFYDDLRPASQALVREWEREKVKTLESDQARYYVEGAAGEALLEDYGLQVDTVGGLYGHAELDDNGTINYELSGNFRTDELTTPHPHSAPDAPVPPALPESCGHATISWVSRDGELYVVWDGSADHTARQIYQDELETFLYQLDDYLGSIATSEYDDLLTDASLADLIRERDAMRG